MKFLFNNLCFILMGVLLGTLFDVSISDWEFWVFLGCMIISIDMRVIQQIKERTK